MVGKRLERRRCNICIAAALISRRRRVALLLRQYAANGAAMPAVLSSRVQVGAAVSVRISVGHTARTKLFPVAKHGRRSRHICALRDSNNESTDQRDSCSERPWRDALQHLGARTMRACRRPTCGRIREESAGFGWETNDSRARELAFCMA